MGIGEGEVGGDLIEHVLGQFAPTEKPEVERMVDRAADAVLRYLAVGIAAAMNEFN